MMISFAVRLLRDAHRKELARSLQTILQSSSSDDAVSGEVLELIGFDEIDLAMEIIGMRRDVSTEVSIRPRLPFSEMEIMIAYLYLKLGRFLDGEANGVEPETTSQWNAPAELVAAVPESSNKQRKGKRRMFDDLGKANVIPLHILVTPLLIYRYLWLLDSGKVLLTEDQVRANMEASLQAAANRPLFTGTAVSFPPAIFFVF